MSELRFPFARPDEDASALPWALYYATNWRFWLFMFFVVMAGRITQYGIDRVWNAIQPAPPSYASDIESEDQRITEGYSSSGPVAHCIFDYCRHGDVVQTLAQDEHRSFSYRMLVDGSVDHKAAADIIRSAIHHHGKLTIAFHDGHFFLTKP